MKIIVQHVAITMLFYSRLLFLERYDEKQQLSKQQLNAAKEQPCSYFRHTGEWHTPPFLAQPSSDWMLLEYAMLDMVTGLVFPAKQPINIHYYHTNYKLPIIMLNYNYIYIYIYMYFCKFCSLIQFMMNSTVGTLPPPHYYIPHAKTFSNYKITTHHGITSRFICIYVEFSVELHSQLNDLPQFWNNSLSKIFVNSNQ